LAGQNKFEKMLKQNSNARVVSSDARLEREVRKQNLKMIQDRLKEFKISDPENYKKAKILSKKHHINLYNFIGIDLSAYDKKGNLIAGKQDVSIIKDEHPDSFSILDKTTKTQNNVKSKIQYQDSPIYQTRNEQYSQNNVQSINQEPLHEDDHEIQEEQGTADAYEQSNETYQEQETKKPQPESANAPDYGSIEESLGLNDDFETKNEAVSENENYSQTQNQQENKNINSHISKIDFSELDKARNEILREKGELPAEENLEENSSNESTEEQSTKEASQPVQNKKQKRGLFSFFKGKEQKSNTSSVYEDLSNVQQEANPEPEQQEENEFEGMTEDEIAAELERRRRLADLKQKYSDEGAKDPNDIGEYKKSLDFSINLDIKHFKVKPPKKPIIISLICVFLALITAGVITFFVLRKPPEPPHLVSAKLSQQTTHQYVGDKVDLRGLYIEELWSDKSKQIIAISNGMISSKSSNIDENLKILSNSSNTYIEFTYNGETQRLVIVLNEMSIAQIESIEVYQDSLVEGSVLKFENILVLAKIVDTNGQLIGTKRLSASDATFEIEGVTLEKTSAGVILSNVSSGSVTLKITFVEKDNTFTKNVTITID
jgi:hypothetical protein